MRFTDRPRSDLSTGASIVLLVIGILLGMLWQLILRGLYELFRAFSG